jgi:hypothetical protein
MASAADTAIARHPHMHTAALKHAPTELLPGQILDGFTVEKKLGEGGMANLYLALDGLGNRRVIKMPHCSLGDDPVSRVAFENELRLAPYLKDFEYAHMPYAWGPADAQYLVMDSIPGMDLWDYLEERDVLTEPEAWTWCSPACATIPTTGFRTSTAWPRCSTPGTTRPRCCRRRRRPRPATNAPSRAWRGRCAALKAFSTATSSSAPTTCARSPGGSSRAATPTRRNRIASWRRST